MMSRSLFVATFLAACFGFSCVYAAYREEEPKRIIERSARYFLSMLGGFVALGAIVQIFTTVLPSLLAPPAPR